MIIDFHTHAFPDDLARRAIGSLVSEGGIPARHAGTISALLASMDRAGIEASVVCSVATRPSQFGPILEWSRAIASERIIPFPSLIPHDPAAPGRVREVARAGFRGIKIHPYYQDFDLDDESCFPFYEAVSREGLLLASHAGFDFAFPFVRRADPARVVRVARAFPGLKLVVTHLGAWEDWDEVEKHLLGRPFYIEMSFAFGYLERDRIRRFLLEHPEDRLLFGTDSPWTGQAETVRSLLKLGLPARRLELLLSGNARRLLAAG